MSLPRSSELEDVLGHAHDVARKTGDSLSSGHILLALFTVSNEAAVFLEDRNITLEELLDELDAVDDEPPHVLECIHDRSQRIADGANADELNSLHVLASVVRETESQAHELLDQSETDVSAIRATVMSYATGALPLPRQRDVDEPHDTPIGADASGSYEASPDSGGTPAIEENRAEPREDAPSPIPFHPSLGGDSDAGEPIGERGGAGRDTNAPSSASGAPARRPDDRSPPGSTTARPSGSRNTSTTQIETEPPSSDLASEAPPPAPDDNARSGGRSRDVDGERVDSVTEDVDYESSAKQTARSLGSRLFEDSDSDGPPDPDTESPPHETAEERESSTSPDAREASEVEPDRPCHADPAPEEDDDGTEKPDGGASTPADVESESLAGGRATTIPPSDPVRREQSESWDPDLAEAYELDEDDYPHLCEFGRNLTREAALGGIDRILGRDDEITKLIDIVGKRRANNPILVGESGVGKTAIVEGLAREFVRFADDGRKLGERVIVELELGRVLSGTQLRGALSERLQGIKEEVERADGDVIVFLDEIHGWLDAGGSDGSDAAGELKTATARGRFPCIGATTNEEFREFIEDDPAFERRFEVVLVDEPDAETAVEITEGIRPYYEDHHGVNYTDEALEAAVHLSRRYIHDRRLPDKAIGVLDLTGSRAARVGVEQIGRAEIAEVVAESAGLPVDRLTQDDRERFLEMEGELAGKIVGQDHVIETVAEVLRRNYAGFRGERPIGSLLFLGPTGVGKTETVKVLADFLFHDRDAVVQLDMSEFMESHAVSRFVGAPPGYVGHDQGGQLTEAVRRRPYQIVLLDEIEKAHRDVRNVLLQLFEEGELTDGKGRTVDFSNALIVMTSNLGAERFEQEEEAPRRVRIGFGTGPAADGPDPEEERTDDVLEVAREHFSPELWNRIDEKLVFTPLSRNEVARIARLQIDESAERIREESGIELEYGDDVVDHLIDNGGYDPELGARPMRQAIQRMVEGAVARTILRGRAERGDVVRVVRSDGEIVCEV